MIGTRDSVSRSLAPTGYLPGVYSCTTINLPKKKGAKRIFGHKYAVNAVRDVAEGCAELGVKFLTLYFC